MERTFKSQRGFFTFAQNGKQGSVDYLRLAYGLALSLKISQEEYPLLSVAVTPGQTIPDHYREVFDEVVEIPWGDDAERSEWKLQNEWKAFHITPYRETIKLDCDMIFPVKVDHWWDILSGKDMWISTTPRSFRGENISGNDYYRKAFSDNQVPNAYTALMYFQQSEESMAVFSMADLIFANWQKFSGLYMPKNRPKEATTDAVFALAIKLLGKSDEYTDKREFFSFVHAKTKLQKWDDYFIGESWNSSVPATMTEDFRFKISTYEQRYPVHYHDKQVLTDDMIIRMENYLGVKR